MTTRFRLWLAWRAIRLADRIVLPLAPKQDHPDVDLADASDYLRLAEMLVAEAMEPSVFGPVPEGD